MPKKAKEPLEAENAAEATIELVARNRGQNDRWPLASVKGGVDKMTVERKGNTTIIKIVSPEGGSYLDPDGWQRPKREWRSRRSPKAIDGPI